MTPERRAQIEAQLARLEPFSVLDKGDTYSPPWGHLPRLPTGSLFDIATPLYREHDQGVDDIRTLPAIIRECLAEIDQWHSVLEGYTVSFEYDIQENTDDLSHLDHYFKEPRPHRLIRQFTFRYH